MNVRDFKSAQDRRSGLEKKLSIKLPTIGSFGLDESVVSTKHCENMIGAVQVPVGVAGPLKIRMMNDELGMKDYFVPLATTEGALVASISRGSKAISESGGAIVYSEKFGTTRGPVFLTYSIKKTQELSQWILNHKAEVKKIAESTSSHLKFNDTKLISTGNYLFVRFIFDCEEAMGMNMVTIATQAICDYIQTQTGIESIVAGNFDIDKKASWLNFINNRGIPAWAEVVLSEEIVQSILKITPQKLFDTWLAKCMVGSAISGSLGFNAHFANVVAAIFLATGQDPAHVVEGSQGITTMQLINDNIYISTYLPSLMIGTVGGGIGLATQKEALSILKLDRGVEEFAEVIAATVLAGEISLLASLSAQTLASSHKKLGRGEKNS
jgi:hydroxymethylglutaryl-CoA reductase (NADPH)